MKHLFTSLTPDCWLHVLAELAVALFCCAAVPLCWMVVGDNRELILKLILP